MLRKLILISILLISVADSFAQQIPLGQCGIVYIYDLAGNRTRRLYFCNNGIDPYPSFAKTKTNETDQNIAESFTKEEIKTMVFEPVEALYPNPTSGIFFITFSKALQNAVISIIDLNGKTVQQFRASGIKLTCNLSAFAAGTYFVRIQEKENVITKKVIKQ